LAVTFEDITSIENYAFYSASGNTALASVTIGNSVTAIGDYAFYNCANLRNITIRTNKVTNTDTNNWLTRFPATVSTTNWDVTFEDVTSIGDYAFYSASGNNGRLASVTIGNGVTSIGGSAFEGCARLASVRFRGTIPSESFDSSAFTGDLRDKFYATDATNGTPGTYKKASDSSVWTKQP
jgi:hypothetical protein